MIMGAYDRLNSSRSIWWSILGYVVGFLFSFAIVYWIGTKDLGLCFVIALALANGTNAAQQEVRSLCKTLLPAFQQVDDNINSLFEVRNRLEEQIEELEDKIKDLDNRIDDLENR
jgi:peptidoglycan hydrolase CwlO-like protein